MLKWVVVVIGSIILYAAAYALASIISMFTGVDVNWLTLVVLLVIMLCVNLKRFLYSERKS